MQDLSHEEPPVAVADDVQHLADEHWASAIEALIARE